jgi:hypothetical protein
MRGTAVADTDEYTARKAMEPFETSLRAAVSRDYAVTGQ